jgi:signal peptide peptidase SppA
MKRGLADMPHLLERLRAPLLVGGKGGGLGGARSKLDVILTGLSDRLLVVAPLAEMPQVEADARPEAETVDGVAVIPIVGSLVHRKGGMEALSGMTSYAEIAADIDAALADSNVQGILLEIDSPGGEVSGCFELADKIAAASKVKPIHAIADSMACSAAYALACACDSITVTRTGDVGSVGVVAMHVDQSAYDQQQGLKFTYVYAGDRKVDGNPHEALSPRAHDAFQGDIDKIYQIFVKHVAEARKLSQTAVRGTEAGTFMGEAAVKAELADQVGTLEDAIAGLRAEIKRSKVMKGKLAATFNLDAETATDEELLAKVEAVKAEAEQAGALRTKLAELEAAAKVSAEQVAALKSDLATRDAALAESTAKAKGLAEQAAKRELERVTAEVDGVRESGAKVGVLMTQEDRETLLSALTSQVEDVRKLGRMNLARFSESIKAAEVARNASPKSPPADGPAIDLEAEAGREKSLIAAGVNPLDIHKDARGRIDFDKTREAVRVRAASAPKK